MPTPEDIMNMQPPPGAGGNMQKSFMSSSSKGGVTETQIVHENNGQRKIYSFRN